DGRQVRFVVFDGGKAKIETPAPIDAHQLRRWVESLAALHRRGLTADNLVEDFAVLDATDESAGRRLALACYNSLGTPTKKTWSLTRFGGHKRLVSERCPSRRFKHAANASTIPT